MSVHHGLPARWAFGTPDQPSRQARYAATAAAGVTALLYVLSCTVGSIKLGFGLAMGAVFVAVAIFLFFAGQRLVWDLVAIADVGAIIGYFIVAPSRDPHFEAWGIAIKVVQVVLLAILGYAMLGHRRARERG